MPYKTELHCHTSEFSRCANQSGVDKVQVYLDAGYTSVVVTNHFCSYYPEHKNYEKFTRDFFAAADVMREAAGDRLHIITGMELTFSENGNDYLVYGFDEETLLSLPEIFDMGLAGFYPWAKEHGIIIVQAHPLRFNIRTREPWLLDGIEIYNGGHHQFCNDAAMAWADLYDHHYNDDGRYFIRTSGSDHHRPDQFATGGIETDEPLITIEDVVTTLKSGNYRLVTRMGTFSPTEGWPVTGSQG